jgi:hypothetical protein
MNTLNSLSEAGNLPQRKAESFNFLCVLTQQGRTHVAQFHPAALNHQHTVDMPTLYIDLMSQPSRACYIFCK